MSWRALDETRGDGAKAALRAIAEAGKLRGVLAYADGEPIGWCAYGPRAEFRRAEHERMRSMPSEMRARVESAEMRAPAAEEGEEADAMSDACAGGTGCAPCFFVREDWRGRGVARRMLLRALQAMRAEGLATAEVYPLPESVADPTERADWSFTGPAALFAELGFERIDGARIGPLECREIRLDEE